MTTAGDASTPTLVVGTDGSTWASAAVSYAAELARDLSARVVVVHAVPLLDHLPDGPSVVASDVRNEIELKLNDQWVAPLRELGIPYTTVMENGPPLLAIPRVAERERAAMIIVATHGQGERLHDRLGSTTFGLAGSSPVPLVIVPR